MNEAQTGDLQTTPAGARRALDWNEQEIAENVLRMGTLVQEQIRAAIEAFVAHDPDQAMAVIAGDGRINEAQRHTSALVVRAIATQQPVARDLRFLLSLDHVVSELERIGDHATGVAKQARMLASEAPGQPPPKRAADVGRMGELGIELLGGALRALVDIDADAARAVAQRDDEIDALYRRVFGDAIELMRDEPAHVERGARVLLAALNLERIGDRVTNIAEDVVYLATGEVEDLNP